MTRYANRVQALAACASLVALTLPSMANAQEITLQTADGNTISGELIEFNNNNYLIDSRLH